MYLYGLCIHKLAHFHDIVHGTRHNFYMNEVLPLSLLLPSHAVSV